LLRQKRLTAESLAKSENLIQSDLQKRIVNNSAFMLVPQFHQTAPT
jgi:hypothetical protein